MARKDGESFFGDYFGYNRTPDFIEGLREGIRLYSYMKDGVSYVGTTGKTLKSSLAEIDEWQTEIFDRNFKEDIKK